MPIAVHFAGVMSAINGRYNATAKLHAANEGMYRMLGQAGPMTPAQMQRFGALGKQLEIQAAQSKVMLAVNNLLQQQREKRLMEDIKMTFGGLGQS